VAVGEQDHGAVAVGCGEPSPAPSSAADLIAGEELVRRKSACEGSAAALSR
jgi:hypothetical protein